MFGLDERIRWGVITDAKARQRREQRALRLTGLLLITVVGAIVWTTTGGSSPAGEAPPTSGSAIARSSGATLTACLRPKGMPLSGRPSESLLAILAVLRRPATKADALPPQIARNISNGDYLGTDPYVHYIRRARVVDGISYYLFPVRVRLCVHQPAHDGLWDLATHVPYGHGIYGSVGGGGGTAAGIEAGRDIEIGPPGSRTSATIDIVVPDGVATVTLHFAAGPANGFQKSIVWPRAIVTTSVVNNLAVVRVPRSGGTAAGSGDTMTWRAADGHIIATFNRL